MVKVRFLRRVFCHGNAYIRAGQLKRDHPPMTVPTIWEVEENLQGDEQQKFLNFIRAMLCWQPDKRMSAKELLQHPWLVIEGSDP